MISPRLSSYLLVLMCACPLPALSETSKHSDALRFVTAEVWPWGYHDADRAPAGMASKLATRLADAAGLPLNNRVLPYQRVLFEFQQGQADFAILFKNPELDRLAENLGEVIHTGIYLVALRDSELQLDLTSLSGKKVGHIRGTVYGNSFEHNNDILRVAVSNMEQAIDMLTRHRLDALISSDFAFASTLEALNMGKDDFRVELLTESQAAVLYMSRTPRNPQHAEVLREALELIKRDGSLQSSAQKISTAAETFLDQ